MDHERINQILNSGIRCPICGMQLIDLEHDGYNGKNPDLHDYYCTNCFIGIEINNEFEVDDSPEMSPEEYELQCASNRAEEEHFNR